MTDLVPPAVVVRLLPSARDLIACFPGQIFLDQCSHTVLHICEWVVGKERKELESEQYNESHLRQLQN